MATFEQPLNERVRTFLRLEQLSARIRYHSSIDKEWDTHMAILLLLDLYELTSRLDLKSEVMKELERHGQILNQFSGSSQINTEQLAEVLNQQRDYVNRLHEQKGQITQHIKANEFLNNVRQRCAASGSACSYDLPVYHHWLNLSHAQCRNAINEWMEPFNTTLQAIELILDTIRQSTGSESLVAQDGFFQQALSNVRTPQLIRVVTSGNIFPEISGNKHRMSIRFFNFCSVNERTVQANTDVSFEIALCTI